MSNYADAHCHLADSRIANDVDRFINEAGAAGISLFVQGGVGPDDWERQAALKSKYPGKIVTAFGLHPWWVASHTNVEFETALEVLKKRLPQADAFGEIGLDHGAKVEASSHALQARAFQAQLELVQDKPLVLHVVKAHEQAISVLKAAKLPKTPGLVHSFSASQEIAKKYLDLGFTLSISGVITRKGFETLRRAVSYIPADQLVLETDAPDQPPEGWGKPWNEPVALFQVADAIGKIRGETPETLLRKSTENVRRIFNV